MGEETFWESATQTGSWDVILVLAEHRGLCGPADASWKSQLEDSARHSWRGSVDVDDFEERRGKLAVEDADVQEMLSQHEMWIEYEVANAGSCARACSLMWEARPKLTTDDFE